MSTFTFYVDMEDPIRLVEHGDDFCINIGREIPANKVWISRQHAELMLAQLHRLFGMSPAVVDAGNPLDDAYEAVNAEGGTSDGTEYGNGYVDGITASLTAIEQLGGKSPIIRRSDADLSRPIPSQTVGVAA